jgi:hypothetical protein
MALTPADYQKVAFQAAHANDSEVQKAFSLLVQRGILSQDSPSSESGFPDSDCLVLADQRILKSSLLRDLMNRQLPKEVLAIDLAMVADNLLVTGRLDGPAFVNPKFEARIAIQFLRTNCFRFRFHGLKVMGFNASIFNGLIKSYLEDAFRRIFPEGCTTRFSLDKDGSILADATISPEGFVPGLGKKAFLSHAGIKANKLFLGFTIPSAR